MPEPGTSTAAAPTRRDQILGLASEFFLERGYSGTGVDEIGEAAGVTGSALYRYFAGKQAILDAIVTEGLGRLVEATEAALAGTVKDPRGALERLVRARVEFAFGPDRLTFALYRNQERHLSDRARAHARFLAERDEAEWLRHLEAARPGVPADELAIALTAAHSLVGYLPTRAHAVELEALKGHVTRMVLAALGL
jgi:AcrR family transcriptional regulator